MKFITKISSHATLHTGYKDRYIEETVNTKFLGLQIDKHLNWNNDIEQMVPKLSTACYAMTSVVYISNIDTFKSVYCAHFHFVIKYGIILWGNSSKRGEMFTLQKKIIRIMAGAQPRISGGWTDRKTTDGKTDMTKLTGALCNFANTPKKVQLYRNGGRRSLRSWRSTWDCRDN